MKTAVFAIYAVYASNLAHIEQPRPSNYDHWVARITAASTGQRPTLHNDASAFVNWSKNYPSK